ncbi:MAG: transcriptional regulator, CadC, partial [Bryobacterales bacterium]|nr:transcriptional regulator, CadC [Bryobacterales bacterium]
AVRPTRMGLSAKTKKLRSLMRRRDLVIGGGTAAAAIAAVELFHLHNSTSPLLRGEHIKTIVEDFTSSSNAALGRAVRSLFRIALAHSPKVSLVKPTEVRKALEDLGAGIVPVRGELARAIAQNLGVRLALAGEVNTAGTGYRLRVTAIETASGRKVGTFDDSVQEARDLPMLVHRVAIHSGLASGDELAGPQIEGTPLDQADTGHPDALEMLAAGLERYQNGEFQVAQEYLEEATKIDSEFAIAYVYLASIHGTLRRWDLAFEPAARAYSLRQKVSSRQRHHAEALYYIVSGDWESARQAYYVLAQLYPNDAEAHRNLAQAWAIELRPDLELQQNQEAVRLDPQNALSHTMLVCAYADLGKFSDAAHALEQAEKTLPRAPLLLAAKGYVRLLQSDTAGALNYYGELAKNTANPDIEWVGRSYQARALLLGGQIEQARSQLERELSLIVLRGDQANEDLYRYWAGQLFVLTGEGWRAVEHAATLAQRDPIAPNLFALRAAAELAWHNRDSETLRRAHQKLKSIADKNPNTRSKAIFAQCDGLQASLEGRASHAITLLSRAHAFWPDISCSSTLAEVLSMHGATQDALGFYKQILEAKWAALRFECVLVWIRSAAMAGHVLKALGKYHEAVSCCDLFLTHWGANQQLPFVHQVIEARNDCLKKTI